MKEGGGPMRRQRKIQRDVAAFAGALALAGCGSGDKGESNNPLDYTKKNVQWSVDTKKDLRDSARARATEADKIIGDRLKAK